MIMQDPVFKNVFAVRKNSMVSCKDSDAIQQQFCRFYMSPGKLANKAGVCAYRRSTPFSGCCDSYQAAMWLERREKEEIATV